MIGTIVYIRMNTQNRESAKDTGLSCFLNTFTNCRNIFLRNSTTDYGRLEQQCRRLVNQDVRLRIKIKMVAVCFHGLEFHFTVTILSTSTGLLSVLGIHFNSLGKCFLVCNLRCTNVCFYLELTKQTVNDDLQMELTHTCDNGLSGLLIGMSTESRIFLSQLCKRLAHLALTSLGLRLDSKLDNGLREFHGLKDYRVLLVTDGITGSSYLETNCSCNITGVNLIQFFSLICMHLKDTSYTLLLILGSIKYIRTGVQGTGVHTDKCKLTYKRVSHNLECKCGERLFIGRMSYYLVAVKVNTLNCRYIQRRRHILNNSIQELLNTLVSVCGTAADRDCPTLAGSQTKCLLHFFYGRLLTLQIHHHQIVIQFTNLLNELIMIQCCFISHISKIIGNGDIITLLIIVDIGLHFKQVNDSLEFIFLTDRQLNTDSILAKSVTDLINCCIEVCTQDVHLIDESHTRYIVGVSLTPYVFRLRLYTTLCTEHAYCAVQYTKGTLYFYSKVNVSGGINDIDTML